MTTGGRRVLGVDLGSRRIGLAASDPSGVLASPYATLDRAEDPAENLQVLLAVATEIDADRIVVGLPRSLSGDLGPAARSVLAEVAALRELALPLGIEVETHDERFTTLIAQQALQQAVPRRMARQQAQTDRLDAAAATVILQSWIDAGGAGAPG